MNEDLKPLIAAFETFKFKLGDFVELAVATPFSRQYQVVGCTLAQTPGGFLRLYKLSSAQDGYTDALEMELRPASIC